MIESSKEYDGIWKMKLKRKIVLQVIKNLVGYFLPPPNGKQTQNHRGKIYNKVNTERKFLLLCENALSRDQKKKKIDL